MKLSSTILAGLLAGFMLVSPFSVINKTNIKTEAEPEEDNGRVIRVATYNIRNGADVDHDFTVIADDILKNGVEIVGFQEVDKRTGRSKRTDGIKLIAEATGYEYYEFLPCIDYDGGLYGTAVLSKYPIESFEMIELPSDEHEQRMLGHAEINVDGVIIDFFNTHLSWESQATRQKQLAEINNRTAECDKFIVTADFNTSNFDELAAIENSSLVNNPETKMTSCGEDGAIDNIVYSGAFKVKNYGMYDEVSHSDHNMVWADLSFELPAEE